MFTESLTNGLTGLEVMMSMRMPVMKAIMKYGRRKTMRVMMIMVSLVLHYDGSDDYSHSYHVLLKWLLVVCEGFSRHDHYNIT
jgi:hypothetical protein